MKKDKNSFLAHKTLFSRVIVLSPVKIRRYSSCIHTYIYIHKRTSLQNQFLVHDDNRTPQVRQVISKNPRDESRCIFTIHSVRVPLRESITLLFPPYKKCFTRHELRPLRNDILSCDIPTVSKTYSVSSEQVLRSIRILPSSSKRFRSDRASENQRMNDQRAKIKSWRWMALMDRSIEHNARFISRCWSGKVYIIREHERGKVGRGNGNHRKSRRVFTRYAIKVRYNVYARDTIARWVRGKFEKGIYVQAQFHGIISVGW